MSDSPTARSVPCDGSQMLCNLFSCQACLLIRFEVLSHHSESQGLRIRPGRLHRLRRPSRRLSAPDSALRCPRYSSVLPSFWRKDRGVWSSVNCGVKARLVFVRPKSRRMRANPVDLGCFVDIRRGAMALTRQGVCTGYNGVFLCALSVAILRLYDGWTAHELSWRRFQ
ncbi:hypothetical protein EXIGLDRAFT_457005 [Exidia glandulosa HHB12029]|uniref:Uncharacterized protein n=1 Tax=Exidia glandulosa HHB12029 TaxID=1314781 RepID=A0A165PNF0_EXIGL|nr:hypothetical protein EXIGLDRAFT_457005 [Exidia glandulosa HHB12029]